MNVGIGVIGSGFMGRTWTEVATHHVEGARVVAVAGGRRSDALAREYDVAAEPSPAALIARPDVDLVVIATPPQSHRDLAVSACRAGRHVLVEKPMATSVGESDAMVAAAESAGTVLSVVSQHRFRSAPLAAHRLLSDGAIGSLRMVRVEGIDLPGVDPLPGIPPFDDLGSHLCDVLRWLVDSPATAAFAQFRSFTARPPADQSAMAIYTFESGVMASVWISYEVPRPGLGSMMQYLLVGSAGMIRLDSYGQVLLGRGGGWSLAFEQPAFDPNNPKDPVRLQAYADQLRDVLAAVRGGAQPTVGGRWARDTMELLDAARISAATGDPVTLPIAPAGVRPDTTAGSHGETDADRAPSGATQP